MLDSLKSAVAAGLEDALYIAIETGNRAEALQIMYSVRDALDAQQITKDQAMRIYKDYDAYLDSLA